MLSIEEFKKSLPDSEKYTDEEIARMRNDMDKLADIFSNEWLAKKNKKVSTNDEH